MSDLTSDDLDCLRAVYAGYDHGMYDPKVAMLLAEVDESRARVVGGTDGPDQGDPAARPPYLWAWRISHLTWSGTVDEETATSMAAEYGQAPVPLYRAPGAVAAAAPGDEVKFVGYIRDEPVYRRRAAPPAGRAAVAAAPPSDEDAAAEAERLAAHGGSVALPWNDLTETQKDTWRHRVRYLAAPPAGHENVAAAPPGDEVQHGSACNDGIEIAHGAGPDHVYVCHGECLDAEPAPPAGHEDEAAVERADEYAALQMSATTARARGDYDAERQALDRLHLLDLAAARGPRTPDPGAGA